MSNLVSNLVEANVGKVWVNEPLSNHTTWKIGGPAEILFQPKNKEGLVNALRLIFAEQIPYLVIGRGSNLLVRDKGIRGIVIKLGEGLDYVDFRDDQVVAGAGYSFMKLARKAAQKGLTGLEFAGGIPGTVGGAVYMNAGAHGSDVSRVLHSAEVLFEDGELAVLSNEEMDYSYRTSILQNRRKGICLEATFTLSQGESKRIKQDMQSLG